MAPFKMQLPNTGMKKVASFATKAAKKAAPFIQKQLQHPATTQFLKNKVKTAALLGRARGGNPAAMGAVATNFGKDVATRTINHYLK